MTKIEQYKFDTVVSHRVVTDCADLPSYLEGYEKGWDDGFNHCMNIGLAVKFAEWLKINCQPSLMQDHKEMWFDRSRYIYSNTKELFNNWLENIWNYEI